MLQLTIHIPERWNDQKQEFIPKEEKTVQLEHSLVSISKWESRWKKPFLSKNNKSEEETLDYIRCMTVTNNINPDIYQYLSNSDIDAICAYIDEECTATTVNYFQKNKQTNQQVTSELIYYRMISLGIPFECQKWHLSRLLKLIDIFNAMSQKTQKNKSTAVTAEMLQERAALNRRRRAELHSKG